MMKSQAIDLDINPELFNNLYWHLKDLYANPNIRYIWLMGGSSASKTYSDVQVELTERLEHPDQNVMIFRKYGSDILDSIYADHKGIIGDWEANELFTCQQNLIKCATGSYIRFRGMDDSEKIKGMARIKRVVLEEVSQFDKSDFKQVRKRLRGRRGQQIVGMFNPISEDHWIKTDVFDKEQWTVVDQVAEARERGMDPLDWCITEKKINAKGNAVILRATYKDNYWIVGKWRDGKLVGGFVDKHVIDDFEYDKAYDYDYYRIYALAEWGKIRTGGEYYKHFKEEKHLSDKAVYNPDLPLYMSWDENVNPYLPVLISQTQGRTKRYIDEIALPNPRNTIKDVCAEFIARYKGHKAGLFIGGDATSRKEDVKLEKGHNFFRLIMDELSEFRPVLKVSKSNPSVVMRGQFIGNVMYDNAQGIVVIINPLKCPLLVADLINVKEAADGTKDKKKTTDEKTGVSYQKYGHLSDAMDYDLCETFKTEYLAWQAGGKKEGVKRSLGYNAGNDANRF